MAERRMFAKTIIDSDAFLDMPLTTQALYFHLSMRADDDGFVNNPKKIQRMIGTTDDDIKLLLTKRFILVFDSGVIVIKHWRMHNYIQKDRYKPTVYQEEKSQLNIADNKSYTECIQNVSKLDTQVRLGQVSVGQVRLGQEREKVQERERINNNNNIPNNTTTFYEEHFGKLTTVKKEIIDGWLSDYGDEAVWDAMQTAALAANVTNPLAYIGGVLKNKNSKTPATKRVFRGEQGEDNVDIVL